MRNIKQKHVFLCLVAIFVTSCLFLSHALYRHITYKNEIVQTTKNKVQSETERITSEIGVVFQGISSAVDTAAKDFAEGKINEKDLVKELAKISQSDANIIKFGLILEPVEVGQEVAYQPVCYERKEGKMRPVQETASRDFRKEPWCDRDVTGGAGWDEPLFDDTEKYYTVTFSVPVYRPAVDGKAVTEASGGLYVDVSLAWLREKMDSISLEKNDLGIILSKKGAILYHPISDIVLARSNIFDTLEANKANNKNYEKQKHVMQKAINGERGSGVSVARTGVSFWYFYEPINSTGWALVVNFMNDTMPLNGKVLRRQQICIAVGLIFFLTSLAALFSRVYDPRVPKQHRLWSVVIIFSFLCFTVACYTWYLALARPFNEYQQNKTVIDDPVSLNRFMTTATKLSQNSSGTDPIFVPTGIYIQSMDFLTSNDIAISGYVWQRYLKGSQDNVPRGFILPESEAMTVAEAYRQEDGKDEVIGWYFTATVRQSFDYSKYPFDHPNISIWLRHKDFLHNVILVPDLKGYKFINANTLPGLQAKLVLPGYALSGTFFSHEPKLCNTNFGLVGNKREVRTSELCYNAIITRNFITPLVSKFFPIFIVISMLFVVILSFSTDTVKQKNFGLSGLAIIGLVVSFFFTTLLTQIDLRQQLRSDSIIFIENFNFITYFVLLLSAIQAFLFSAEKKIWAIQYEHCLIPKLLYWPVFTVLVLAISLVYFF